MQRPRFQRWELLTPDLKIHSAVHMMVQRLADSHGMRHLEEIFLLGRCSVDAERTQGRLSKVAQGRRRFADGFRFCGQPEPTLLACPLNPESLYTKGFHARLNSRRCVRESN